MSRPREPLPAKLVIGVLFRDFGLQRSVLEVLCERFGPLDFLSAPEPFTHTAYYEREMGPGIHRCTASFLRLVASTSLPDVKLFTNDLEARYSSEGRRQVNLDPGILSVERLVLASGKNFIHRVYLRDGIYADLTLIYQGDGYQVLPWTFPDHRSERLRAYFGALRKKLVFQRDGTLPRKGLRPHEGGSP
ncbi:MAG: DUF4416 family protein [Acidobacteriota bacterium]